MTNKLIDAHIHFDLYTAQEREVILNDLSSAQIDYLIAVSMHLASANKTLQLARKHPVVKPAFGFHPEQNLPPDKDVSDLLAFIDRHQEKMIAIGEVGLPHYLRREDPSIPLEPYLELLEQFIEKSGQLQKPIVLHAVYEDAPLVCNLLEAYSIEQAHFHWFKGEIKTIKRMITNGYYVSVTPDLLYKENIQQLVKIYPLDKLMVETDGPWTFAGPFSGKMTHPKMMHETVEMIARIKKENITFVYHKLYENTKQFYRIKA